MKDRADHHPEYRGVRHVTVTCSCGWVSENHRSLGEARRAHEGHAYLKRAPFGPVGVNAHRAPR